MLLESVQRCLILVCIPAGTGRQLIRPPDRQLLHITADWTVHAKVQRRVPSISYSATCTCLVFIIIMCCCFCFTRLLDVVNNCSQCLYSQVGLRCPKNISFKGAVHPKVKNQSASIMRWLKHRAGVDKDQLGISGLLET